MKTKMMTSRVKHLTTEERDESKNLHSEQGSTGESQIPRQDGFEGLPPRTKSSLHLSIVRMLQVSARVALPFGTPSSFLLWQLLLRTHFIFRAAQNTSKWSYMDSNSKKSVDWLPAWSGPVLGHPWTSQNLSSFPGMDLLVSPPLPRF